MTELDDSSSVPPAPPPHYDPTPSPTSFPPGAPPPPSGKPPGLGFGVFLIVLGAAIIIARLIPGIEVWEMWPIIIIALGIRTMVTLGSESKSRAHRIAEGLTTVSVGLIFLGNTTGALSWSVWLSVFSLWPLLLIGAGLDIIGKGTKNSWLRVASSLLVLAGLWYGALVLPSAGFNPGLGLAGPRTEPFSFSEKADDDVMRGNVSIVGAVGEMSVADGDDLVSAEGETPFGEPEFSVDSRGSRTDIELSLGEHGAWTGYRGHPRLDVRLSADVAWDIEIESGVSNLEADMSDLSISKLAIASGVSNSELRLGEPRRSSGIVSVTVGSGVSSTRIMVPEGVPFRVSAGAGLANVEIDGKGGPTVGGRQYSTSDYDGARSGYDIEVGSGVANVIVEIY